MWEMPNRDRLTIGRGGWVRYTRDSAPGLVVFQRFEEDRAGKLVLVEEYTHRTDDKPLLVADLQSTPRRRIATWVNVEGNLRGKMNLPGPDLRRAAAWFSGWPSSTTWVGQMLRAQIDGSGVPQQRYPGRAKAPTPWKVDEVDPRADDRPAVPPPDATLDVPSGRAKPDSFYRQVIEVRDRLTLAGVRAPARAMAEANMAEANDADYARVRDWIRMAEQISRTGRRRAVS